MSQNFIGDSQPVEAEGDPVCSQNLNDRGDPVFTLQTEMAIDYKKIANSADPIRDNLGNSVNSIEKLLIAMQDGRLSGIKRGPYVNRYDEVNTGSPVQDKKFLCGFYLEFPDAYTKYIDSRFENEDTQEEFTLVVPTELSSISVPPYKNETVAYNVMTDAEFLRRDLNLADDGSRWEKKKRQIHI